MGERCGQVSHRPDLRDGGNILGESLMQQLGPKVRIGTGAGQANTMGAWAEVMAEVLFDSKWAMVAYMLVDVLPGFLVLGTINLDLGIGPLDQEVRKWKSQGTFQGGSELEFDDTGHTKYCPFNFKKGQRVSVRTARIGSVGHNIEFQLQIFD